MATMQRRDEVRRCHFLAKVLLLSGRPEEFLSVRVPPLKMLLPG